MKVEIYKKDNRLAVQLDGRLVLDVMDAFRSIVEPHITPQLETIFIILSKVEYIDSAGLALLVELKIQAGKSRIRLALVAPSPEATNILAVSRLEEVFEINTGIDAERIISELVDSALRTEQYDTKKRIAHKSKAVSAATGTADSAALGAMSSAPQPQPQPRPAAADKRAVTERAVSGKGVDQAVKAAIEEHCRQAVECLRQGNLEESIAAYKKAIELDPAYIPARNNLAIVYEKKPAWKHLAIEQWEALMHLSQQKGDDKHSERAHKHLAKLRA